VDATQPSCPAVFSLPKLSNTKATDKGLDHVKELTDLKTLHLKGTKVMEDGIKLEEDADQG
jgi:hypothetical protein